MSAPQAKKPFDKKKWRERKYSKKFKVQQWEEKRKKAVIRQYVKELKKSNAENAAAGVSSINPSSSKENRGKKEKLSAYKLARLEFERAQEAKQKKKEEYERRKAEREEALNNYKKRKIERYKKLSKKTKKGQPVMKDRIELLLEKIENECRPSK